MVNRRKSRELALQLLYSLRRNPRDTGCLFDDPLFSRTSTRHREYAMTLVLGVLEHERDFDALITRYSRNWKLNRIALLDNLILRIALFELIHLEDIPPAVSINEAVELSKKFSTVESGGFINGILDCCRKNRDGARGNVRKPGERNSAP